MNPRKDKKSGSNEYDTTWGTLEEIIRTAFIPPYHREGKRNKYPKSGLNLY